MIYQLLYLSRTTRKFQESDLHDILVSARKNNPSYGVTGTLLYAERSFLQILEGTRENVHIIFDKIFTDPRHRSIIKVHSQMVPVRSFPNWAMGYERKVNFEDLSTAFFNVSKQGVEDRISSSSSAEVKKFLRDFYKNRVSKQA